MAWSNFRGYVEAGGSRCPAGKGVNVIGSQDLLVLLGIGIFFFGAKRLPELSRSLGQAMSEFKRGVTGSGAPEEAAPRPAAPGAAPVKQEGGPTAAS